MIATGMVVTTDRAEATPVSTRHAAERVARFAFELAERQGRRRVTVIHKANVLDKTDGLFLKTFRETADQYPEIESDDFMVDVAAAASVRAPESFDVVVALNEYGDILSDLAAEIAGGLGLGPGGLRR